jgi:putative tryptophan/tyrosine transport system substrate-binding protein
MKRREFLASLTGALVMPLSARAQQTTTRTIGWFSLRSADTDTEKRILAAFRHGLGQTGYVEGRNLTIEYGFADGQYDRYEEASPFLLLCVDEPEPYAST